MNDETSSKAFSYLKLLKKFSFIIALVIVRSVLDLTLDVTQLLQGRTNDICDGLELITSMKSNLEATRTNYVSFHKKCHETAVKIATDLDVSVKAPRAASRLKGASGPEEYFRATITVPLLEHVVNDLDSRFDTKNMNAYFGYCAIPEKLVRVLGDGHGSKKYSWQEKFKGFCAFYHQDLPNFQSLDAEMNLWETFWLNYRGTLPHNAITTLQSLPFSGFENMKVALRILATLPITSCECERSFSALRRLKTFARTTMSEERLNGLAAMYIHKEANPDEDRVINRFSVMKNRRVDFN